MAIARARLSANIAFLFAELPPLRRIDAAAAAGFAFVEDHFPYDLPAAEIRERLDAAGIAMNGINTRPGDLAAGEFGRAALPGREADFAADLEEALGYAAALGCRSVHVLAGLPSAQEREAARETYHRNLRRAAARAAEFGLVVLIEPLNARDRPGYLLSRTEEAAAAIEAVGAPNLKILLDLYHLQISEGDVTRRIERLAPLVGHVQLAAVPDRGEPDRGELALPHVLETLERIGYDGLIGLEYKPRAGTLAGLGWIERAGFA